MVTSRNGFETFRHTLSLTVLMRTFRPIWLGRQAYAPVHALQQLLQQRRIAQTVSDTLLLVEHPAVVTLGRGAHTSNVVASAGFLASQNIDVVETERGGDVTYHGPGQLVAYPIFSLEPDRCDVRKYVKDLVRVMALLCADHGIGAGGRDAFIGAWVDLDHPDQWPGQENATHPAKVGAIGVKISRWVTMHGFALNATTRLSDFDLIVPCGIKEYPVTSLENLGVTSDLNVETLAVRSIQHFESVFGATAMALDSGSDALNRWSATD
jgi:lipoyl(octanoyl) transferase